MRFKNLSCFFFFIFILLYTQDLSAQRKEPIPFKERLWYGGGITGLGFSSSFNISLLQAGVSPMAGYKITERWSVGPRASLIWSYYRARRFDETVASAGPISWSVAGFTRFRIIPQIFAQLEYEYQKEAYGTFDGNDILIQRWDRDNYYIGGGYHDSAGLWGYEIVLLYNMNPNILVNQNPLDIRIGVTYKF